MRRALFALALTALTGLALALAGPANAASAQVTQFRFSGTAADAFWVTSTAASVTDTGVTVSTSNQGSQLFVDQFTAYFDANHNFTGSTETHDVTTLRVWGGRARMASSKSDSKSSRRPSRCW